MEGRAKCVFRIHSVAASSSTHLILFSNRNGHIFSFPSLSPPNERETANLKSPLAATLSGRNRNTFERGIEMAILGRNKQHSRFSGANLSTWQPPPPPSVSVVS